jgi:hypothetical protein
VLAVNRILLRNGTLATRTEGAKAPDVEIRGLDIELRDLALVDRLPICSYFNVMKAL